MWGKAATAGLVVGGLALVGAGLSGTSSAAPAPAVAAVVRPIVASPLPTPAAHVRVLPAAAATTTRAAVHRSAPRSAKPVRHRTTPRARSTATATAAATRQPVTQRRAAPPVASFATLLDRAVARIPTYRPGVARWVVSRAYDFWGTADWYHAVLYVHPGVPRDKLYDVVVHEWSHELSVLDYSGDVAAATRAMNAWFGGSDLTGPERAADCMSILQGATWTHYTTCTNAHWRLGARLLLSGKRL